MNLSQSVSHQVIDTAASVRAELACAPAHRTSPRATHVLQKRTLGEEKSGSSSDVQEPPEDL